MKNSIIFHVNYVLFRSIKRDVLDCRDEVFPEF